MGVLRKLLLHLSCLVIVAQASRIVFADERELVSFSGYADLYVAQDFNQLPSRSRAYSTYPYYSGEGALNLGYLDARVDRENYHGRVALQYGSSVVANYANEPHEFFRYIQEAYGGIKLSDKWTIDAGIFLSQYGFESWISRDNYTVTRSLVADNSPYYQMGIRSIHRISGQLSAELHILRGWQNVSDERGPALGTQLIYAPSEDLRLTHNLFFGDEDGARVFNEFGFNYQLTQRFGIQGCYDIGVQNQRAESEAIWHGWSVIPHFKVSDRVAVAARVERYSDPHQVIVQALPGVGFSATGLSVNIDLTLHKSLVWRNEYRVLLATNYIFPRGEGYSGSDSFLISSVVYTTDF